jgi:hypothetical protein
MSDDDSVSRSSKFLSSVAPKRNNDPLSPPEPGEPITIGD